MAPTYGLRVFEWLYDQYILHFPGTFLSTRFILVLFASRKFACYRKMPGPCILLIIMQFRVACVWLDACRTAGPLTVNTSSGWLVARARLTIRRGGGYTNVRRGPIFHTPSQDFLWGCFSGCAPFFPQLVDDLFSHQVQTFKTSKQRGKNFAVDRGALPWYIRHNG